MSKRESAEVQLQALLNDKEESLPVFVRRASAMSLEQLAKQLNTPPFILERLLKVINQGSGSNDESTVNQNSLIKLTRTLNSTLEVRALLFFKVLDEDDDNCVTKEEMEEFLKVYFKSMKFETGYLQDAVQVLLNNFHFETVSLYIYYIHIYCKLSFHRKIKSILKNFIPSSSKIQLYLHHSLDLRFIQLGL